jgi:uncharacterized repeat protein (TIGR03833 family)
MAEDHYTGPPKRSKIKPGVAVWVLEKKNYGTDNYTQGIVKDVLTSKSLHPRGIKVRLTDGIVGRVQFLMEELEK